MPAEQGGRASTAPTAGGDEGTPAAAAAEIAARLARHWQRTRLLTFSLVALWLAVVLGVGVFARELGRVRFFGWPLSYYMGAQGALIVFLAIIGFYALAMRRLDREALGPPLEDSAEADEPAAAANVNAGEPR